jgi:NADH-quinone oxidoreductase subunit F
MLGTGAVIVFDETADMVKVAYRVMKFYAHESCGQCTPCREGCDWFYDILKRIYHGNGKMEDLDLLEDMGKHIGPNTICAFGDAFVMPTLAFVRKFRDEFVAYIQKAPQTVKSEETTHA